MADLYRAPDEWFVVRSLDGKPWQRYAVVRFRDGRFEFAHEDGERTFFLRGGKAEEQAEWLNFVDGVIEALDVSQRFVDNVVEATTLAALDRSHRGCG